MILLPVVIVLYLASRSESKDREKYTDKWQEDQYIKELIKLKREEIDAEKKQWKNESSDKDFGLNLHNSKNFNTWKEEKNLKAKEQQEIDAINKVINDIKEASGSNPKVNSNNASNNTEPPSQMIYLIKGKKHKFVDGVFIEI